MVVHKSRYITRKVIVLFSLIGLFIGACNKLRYHDAIRLPAVMPGAQYVGMETCGSCHEKEHKYFRLSEHSKVTINITDEDAEAGEAEGCETCHGPGSLHLEGYGDKSKIIRGGPDTCFDCHLDIKGRFLLQHRHPVIEGFMTCSDCHSLHGKDVRATGGESLLRESEKCFNCHKEQRGPFVFEHDARREGCQVCHKPHGSINDVLLVAGQTTTCIRCHWQSGFNTPMSTLGNVPHGFIADIGRGAECIDCHTAPHGSNISRSFRR